jgi:hypothetical protein
VIRRGFWLTVGAAAGIMGYRRVSAAGRRLSARLTAAGATSLARETFRFTRDVREGMELYRLAHSQPPGPTHQTLDTDHDPRPKDGR